MRFLRQPQPDDWLSDVVAAAVGMKPGAMVDYRWRISDLTELWLCPQEELDTHGHPYLTWWVRWVWTSGTPIESHYCVHPLLVVAATAALLDKAGVYTGA